MDFSLGDHVMTIMMIMMIVSLKVYKNMNVCGLWIKSRNATALCEERIPTRCNNMDDLLSIPDADY